MKKYLALLFSLLILFTFAGCGSGETESNETKTTTEEVSEAESEPAFRGTEEEIEAIVAGALYESEQLERYVNNWYLDINQTRFSVASIEQSGNVYTARGKVSLYDKYGDFEGSYNYEVLIDDQGSAYYTDVNLYK